MAEESSAPPPNGAVGLDEMLEQAVLGGLQTLKAIELPIQFSDFYSKHMLAHRPPGGLWGGLKGRDYGREPSMVATLDRERSVGRPVPGSKPGRWRT